METGVYPVKNKITLHIDTSDGSYYCYDHHKMEVVYTGSKSECAEWKTAYENGTLMDFLKEI